MKTLGNVKISREIKISIDIFIFQVMTKVVFLPTSVIPGVNSAVNKNINT